MKEKPIIRHTDLWISVGTNDIRAVKGAFTDDMHILGECAYDRYKIVKNCNFVPKTKSNLLIEPHLRGKQTAIIFYDKDKVVRLLVIDGSADLQNLINMAMVEVIERVSLQYIIDEKGIKCSEVDLQEPAYDFLPDICCREEGIYYEDELDFFSCDRWSLFQAALTGNITDHPTEDGSTNPVNPDSIPELAYYPHIQVDYYLETDEEIFDIRHQGIFCDRDYTYIVAAQSGSSLAP